MDINKLIIGEAKEKLEEYKALKEIFGSPYEVQTTKYDGYYIVRTYSAGVFAGNIESRNGKEVVMTNARRIWYWEGAASLSQLAMDGTAAPEKCKFPKAVDRIELTEAIEIIQCTPQAEKSIKGVKEWAK